MSKNNRIYRKKNLLTADSVILIRAIIAVLVPVALPRAQDALAGGPALEHVLWAVVLAQDLVGVVAAVVVAVAEGGQQGAVAVVALEEDM